jgi:hypothetical protein
MRSLIRSWKKIVAWSIFAALLVIGLSWVLINLSMWRHSHNSLFGGLSSGPEEAFEKRSLVAIYRTNTPMKNNVIGVERMQINRPWAYVFYGTKEYSERFSVNPATAPEHMKYIIADKDTVVKFGIYSFETLPAELKVYISGDEDNPIVYFLDQQFRENMDNIATVPFYEKFDAGPLLNDD